MDLFVSEDRLREDVEANASFGDVDADEGRGRTVLTASDEDRLARDRLVECMGDAGLDVHVDAVGNVIGRWTPDSTDPDAAPVAAGSHLDSVPAGGIFDGPLGVYAALESIRAMQDAGVEPERPVAVVNFTEEEGSRFADGLLGSSVACGECSVEAALAETDADGVTLGDALDAIDYRGEGRLDASAWDAWLELHVEQSERLEDAAVPVGVVTTITGITRCDVEIHGEADHAGATPMPDRTDALAAASEFVLDVERATWDTVTADSETAVSTVGKLDVSPNAVNVVPGRVELGVDVRDVVYDSMDAVCDRARRSLARLERERNVETEFERPFDLEPTPMSDQLRRVAHDSGAAASIGTMDLHSGAAHDTMHVAGVTDAALLFVPSRDGISHNPREWTDWADCADATRVLAGSLADLATR